MVPRRSARGAAYEQNNVTDFIGNGRLHRVVEHELARLLLGHQAVDIGVGNHKRTAFSPAETSLTQEVRSRMRLRVAPMSSLTMKQ
jgi:hypothetical protein